MTTWTDTTKSSASWTGVAKSDPDTGYTIPQGIKFMAFIMQYPADIVVPSQGTIWSSPTKN